MCSDFSELDKQLSAVIEEDTEENIEMRLMSVLEEAEDEVREESIRKFQNGMNGLQAMLPNLVDSIFSGAKAYGAPEFSQQQINLTKEFAGSFANVVSTSAIELVKDKETMDKLAEFEAEKRELDGQLLEIFKRRNSKEDNQDLGSTNTLTTFFELIETVNDPAFFETEEMKELYKKMADLEMRKEEYRKNIVKRITPDFATPQNGCILS